MPSRITTKSPSYWRSKSIRDPLYGFIGLSEKEAKLISCSSFLRLQRIKQLSHSFLVYPSATHSRFEHCLGVLNIADRLCTSLELLEKKRESVRSAALLHDIGHGPFSHLFEEVLKRINGREVSHERVGRWIIAADDQMGEILGENKENVLNLLSNKQLARSNMKDGSLAADIISSGIDADKLDYLRRDSYHIGVAYGSFDLERIIHTATTTPNRESICISAKGKDAVENYRLGRYLMHAQVYEHHTRISADQMFLRALEIAIRDSKNDFLSRNHLRVGTGGDLDSANHDRFLKYYLTLDDSTIYSEIGRESKKAAKILNDIKGRRLLKRACEFEPGIDIENAERRHMITHMTVKEHDALRKDIAARSGTDPDMVITYMLTISIKLYGDEILILRRNDIPEELSKVSPIAADPLGVTRFYIFCPNGKQDAVAKAAASYLDVPPEKIKYRT